MPGGGPPALGRPETAITSSILRIMHAASVADFIICSFTANGSTISKENIFPILPSLALIPTVCLPLLCFFAREILYY